MKLSPWTGEDIFLLVDILVKRVPEFGYTVNTGKKDQSGGIALALNFVPTTEATNPKGLCHYLRDIWGQPIGIKQEFNPFLKENGVRLNIGPNPSQEELRRAYNEATVELERQIDHMEITEAVYEQLSEELSTVYTEALLAMRNVELNAAAEPDEGDVVVPMKKDSIRFKYLFTRNDTGQITVCIY